MRVSLAIIVSNKQFTGRAARHDGACWRRTLSLAGAGTPTSGLRRRSWSPRPGRRVNEELARRPGLLEEARPGDPRAARALRQGCVMRRHATPHGKHNVDVV